MYSLNNTIIKCTFWFLLAALYQIFSSINQYIPPLIGIFFTSCVILTYERHTKFINSKLSYYFCFLYIIFAELIHGFELFSIIIAFTVFYFFLFDILLSKIKIKFIIVFIMVSFAYLFSVLVSNMLLYFNGVVDDFMIIGYEYLYFILVEFIISFIIFKDRIV